MDRSALQEVFSRLAVVGVGFALRLSGASLPVIMTAHVLGAVLYVGLAYGWIAERFGRPRVTFDGMMLRRTMLAALPFVTTVALYELYAKVDIVMLHRWIDSAEAGVYAVAVRLVTAPIALSLLAGTHLHQQGLRLGRGKLLTEDGRGWLHEDAWGWLDPEQRALAETHLEFIDTLTLQIEELDGRIRNKADRHPGACLLQTIPGVGPYRSLLIVGEIEPTRGSPRPTTWSLTRAWRPRPHQSGMGELWHGGILRGRTGGCEERWCRR